MNKTIPFFSDNEPELIKQNSASIIAILSTEELDAEKLQEAVESREKLILDFLQNDEAPQKPLLEDLKRSNDALTQLVAELRGDQQGVLVGFLRNRKAVKKYKK